MVDQSEVLDRTFHALADPSRRAIIERLSDGPRSVSELAVPLPMTLAAVVQHVQVLEASGLITTQKVGRVRTCSLGADALQSTEQWLTDRRVTWSRRLDRLGVILKEDRGDEHVPPPSRPSAAAPAPSPRRGSTT